MVLLADYGAILEPIGDLDQLVCVPEEETELCPLFVFPLFTSCSWPWEGFLCIMLSWWHHHRPQAMSQLTGDRVKTNFFFRVVFLGICHSPIKVTKAEVCGPKEIHTSLLPIQRLLIYESFMRDELKAVMASRILLLKQGARNSELGI